MTDLRHLFVRLLQREIDAEALALARDFLQTIAAQPLCRGELVRPCEADAGRTSSPLQGEAGADSLLCPPDLDDPQQLAAALRWHAPAALLQWDWLRGIGHSAGGHRPANALLFRAYLDATGLDDPALALAGQYRVLLNAAGIQLPALGRLADDADLDEAAFLVPCAALSLAAFPREGFGQILGYTQAHCREGHAWLDWLQRQLQRYGLPTSYVERHRALLECHGANLQDIAAADDPDVAAGWNLHRQVQQAGTDALHRELAAPPTARAERMLRRKLPYAVGHHGRVLLQGKSLDAWLEAGDLAALRPALIQSRYVNAESLADSRLLKAMEFGGSMFGVFSEGEQSLLRRWLEEESTEPAGAPSDSPLTRGAGGVEAPAVLSSIAAGDTGAQWAGTEVSGMALNRTGSLTPPPPPYQGGKEGTARELYRGLLNREAHPDSLPAAARYAERVLAWTRLTAPLQRGFRRHFPYSPAAFRQRVDAIHQHELARYRPLQGPPKLGREMYLWGIEQIAPAILVDGCWLENAAGAEPAADEVRRRLLRTFADEAGAGRVEWNHPNVYRRLLESLDIQLPAVDSEEFARHQRLADAAFPMPTYLLAVGAWPERFFPELLGLNLAIELNGLGATYMHAIDALRHHGIDPTIVQLHLSIDNLASGHAALAREAIELHLDEVRMLGGPSAEAAAWRRVWTGYLSLATASLPFAWAGLRRYARWRLAGAFATRTLR